jgi:hypothetical protein
MDHLSSKLKRHLRQLIGFAYERETERSLETLDKEVDAWREHRCSVWDLNQKIHEYHDQTARSLYKLYSGRDHLTTAALAVTRGVLSLDEVDQSLRYEVKNLSDILRHKTES